MLPVKVLFKLGQSIKIPLWFPEELTRLVIQFVFFPKSTSSSTSSTKWRIKTSTSTPATTTPSTKSTTTKAEKYIDIIIFLLLKCTTLINRLCLIKNPVYSQDIPFFTVCLTYWKNSQLIKILYWSWFFMSTLLLGEYLLTHRFAIFSFLLGNMTFSLSLQWGICSHL